ncbi:MAG TPA: TetR family transcriptional regulator, partial [Polyangia bacterium]|nr:TetR family transcriptional regulator [Polyangia bacterium]
MDVRAKILEEATRLFAAHGVDGTAIQDIASAVGVTKQTLLYYYPSKHELQRGVLAHLLSRWSEILPRLLHAVAREDRFDAILDATIEFFAADHDRARLLLREVLDRPVEMRELLAEHAAPWIGLIAESIEKAQAQKRMRADIDPQAYVIQVIHLVVGTFTTATTVRPLFGIAPTRRGLAEARLIR